MKNQPWSASCLARAHGVGGNLQNKVDIMSLGLVLLIVLAVLLVGAFPRWSYSNGWGYAPSGALGVVLLIVLVLLFMGRL
ncbi:hypothetical protein HMPREF1004_02088 [Ralstonia pickettii]|nr:hypothetical protein HMPREF1004_02088 [Ralstonia pickettii]